MKEKEYGKFYSKFAEDERHNGEKVEILSKAKKRNDKNKISKWCN